MTWKMWRLNVVWLLLIIFVESALFSPVLFTNGKRPSSNTILEVNNGVVHSIVVDEPHNLLIGECKPDDEVLHGENIILNNDGKSHVSGTIRINVEGPVSITCVKILDQIPGGEGGYPSYVSGGVGFNYVLFNVTTNYGESFNFYVQVNGYFSDNEEETSFNTV